MEEGSCAVLAVHVVVGMDVAIARLLVLPKPLNITPMSFPELGPVPRCVPLALRQDGANHITLHGFLGPRFPLQFSHDIYMMVLQHPAESQYCLICLFSLPYLFANG